MPPSARPLTWYDGEEVPRAGTSSAAALARRQKLYRSWVWASVALAPLAFLTALVAAERSGGSAAGPSSPGEAAATVALESWLASKPYPLPGGHLVDWAGASRVAQRGSPKWRAEDDRFVVAAGGQLWSASVEVALVPGSQPVVLAGPDLVRLPVPASQPTSGPWPGLSAGQGAPSLVSTAVAGWARAYCSGDPSELRLAVGDNDPAHTYSPLTGVAAERVQVTWYATLPRSSGAVAQVDLWLRWAGERAMPARPVVMDLLVARASGLAPLVVSWGPPGSGPSLKQYEPQL